MFWILAPVADLDPSRRRRRSARARSRGRSARRPSRARRARSAFRCPTTAPGSTTALGWISGGAASGLTRADGSGTDRHAARAQARVGRREQPHDLEAVAAAGQRLLAPVDALEEVADLEPQRLLRRRAGRRPSAALGLTDRSPDSPTPTSYSESEPPRASSMKTAMRRSHVTTSRCSRIGWSHETKMCARSPPGNLRCVTVTSARSSFRCDEPDGEDLGRRRLEEVEQHGEVVRRERPEDALGLAHAARVQAVRVEVLRPSEIAAPQQTPSAQDRRVVERDVADHQDAAEPVRELDQLGALGRIQGQRLLDEHVPARRRARRARARSASRAASRSRRPRSRGSSSIAANDGARSSRGTAASAAGSGSWTDADLAEIREDAEQVLSPRSRAEEPDAAAIGHDRGIVSRAAPRARPHSRGGCRIGRGRRPAMRIGQREPRRHWRRTRRSDAGASSATDDRSIPTVPVHRRPELG